MFDNFNPKIVKSVTVGYSNDSKGWDASMRIIALARSYFLPSTDIVSFIYSQASSEICSFTDYLNHPTIEKKAPFLPIQNLTDSESVKKNQSIYNRLALTSAKIITTEPNQSDIGFHHTVLCQVGMPLKKTIERIFERRNGGASIMLEAAGFGMEMNGE